MKNNNYDVKSSQNISKKLNTIKIKQIFMDSKGLVNIELLFCTLIIILLLIVNLHMIEKNINSNMEIDENGESRFLLNHIANSINEVNSKEYGFNKKIKMPESINGNYYSILINNNEVIIEFNNKKGKSSINPINLIDKNNQSLKSIQLSNGRSYLIKKALANDNHTHTINQSSILIMQVAD